MFNLLANAMFEATRVSASPAAPVRSRWIDEVRPGTAASDQQGNRARKSGTARTS